MAFVMGKRHRRQRLDLSKSGKAGPATGYQRLSATETTADNTAMTGKSGLVDSGDRMRVVPEAGKPFG